MCFYLLTSNYMPRYKAIALVSIIESYFPAYSLYLFINKYSDFS